MSTSTDVDTVTVYSKGLFLPSVLLAVVLAGLVAIGLLRLYRRAVLKSMRTLANSRPNEAVLPEASPLLSQPVRTRLNVLMLDRASSIRAGPAEESLYSNLLRAPWRAAAIYAIAGVCYALVMAASFLAAEEVAGDSNTTLVPSSLFPFPLPFRFLFLSWLHAWPIVLTVNLVAATTWRAKLATASVYFLVLAALGLAGVALRPTFSWGQIVDAWILTNLLGTVLVLAFLTRRV